MDLDWTGRDKKFLILRSGVFAASRRMDVFSPMVRDGASAPPHHEVCNTGQLHEVTAGTPVNPRPVLTKSLPGTSFRPFRGHLSRPACSHVKQLAKQAGDNFDPGRTYVQAGFFYGLLLGGAKPPQEFGVTMTNVQSIASPAIHPEDRAHEADHPSSLVAKFGFDQPLKLDCGIDLAPFQIAYQTYGQLNADRSNAILVCHALTGDQHVANVHPVTGKPGWWETLVGPGRPLDTDRYFIICSNVIGGCMGSTGPASTNPATGKLWGLDFPIITIPDMVRAQTMLIDRLGIETLVLRGRRLDGRHAGAAMDRGLSRSGCSRRWRWPAARGIRRRTSRSTNSAARR